VSEYQYYEFQAIDRPLTDDEIAAVRQLSTRAEIDEWSFTNEYHFGDFKGDPLDMMKRWYDAHLYFANWGTHTLMLRVPRSSVDVEAMRPYCGSECLDLHLTKSHAILVFNAGMEAPDWDEMEAKLGPLLPLREALMAGDLRPLYLGWLAAVGEGHLDDDEEEPPVPPGMRRLTGPLRALARFLYLDDELLAVAAEGGVGEAPEDVTEDEVAEWALAQPEKAKNAWLRRLVGNDTALKGELWRLARQARRSASPGPLASEAASRRTVRQLLDAAEKRNEAEERRVEERRRAQREAAEKKHAAERQKHLDALATREAAAWREVESLIQLKQPAKYDEAVTLIRDLLDVARRKKRESEALDRVRALREKHARKPSLMERLDRAGLGG
jgi:hypothetical protein